MARPLRIQFPGALYYVPSRGNAHAPIFLDARDRERFLAILEDVKEIGDHLGIHFATVSRKWGGDARAERALRSVAQYESISPDHG